MIKRLYTHIMKIANSLLIFCSTVMLCACSGDDEEEVKRMPEGHEGKRTVLVYMAGKNGLSDNLDVDLTEMLDGSRNVSDDDNLIVFVRRNGELQPWVARISDGAVTDSVSMTDLGLTTDNEMACDPQVMEKVLSYVVEKYPATEDYGLVLWGHCLGWLVNDEVVRTRAYALDAGNSGTYSKWMNFTTMAKVFEKMPHLRYVFADCCNFMCLESLYELRGVADYFIGSPAEIPANGAPYYKMTKDLFSRSESFYTDIVDTYYSYMNKKLPLSVVKADEMDALAQATKVAWQKAQENFEGDYADLSGLIHYYNTDDGFASVRSEYDMFYDAGDFFLRYLSEEDYNLWHEALNKAVVEKRMATIWVTNKAWREYYYNFFMTEKAYHGVSMFIPQDISKGSYANYNEDIKQFKWYEEVLK